LIHKAQDMDKWLAPVNTIPVMSPWVPKRCKNSSVMNDLLSSHKWLNSMEIMCPLAVSIEIQGTPCSVYINFKSVTVLCLACYTNDIKFPHPLLILDFWLVMENSYIKQH